MFPEKMPKFIVVENAPILKTKYPKKKQLKDKIVNVNKHRLENSDFTL